MHPWLGLGSGTNCNLTTLQGCAPSYAQLKANDSLWTCPSGLKREGTCGFGNCVESAAGGALCGGQLNASSPCCCPKGGCYTEPQYNTVIGVCRVTAFSAATNPAGSRGWAWVKRLSLADGAYSIAFLVVNVLDTPLDAQSWALPTLDPKFPGPSTTSVQIKRAWPAPTGTTIAAENIAVAVPTLAPHDSFFCTITQVSTLTE